MDLEGGKEKAEREGVEEGGDEEKKLELTRLYIAYFGCVLGAFL